MYFLPPKDDMFVCYPIRAWEFSSLQVVNNWREIICSYWSAGDISRNFSTLFLYRTRLLCPSRDIRLSCGSRIPCLGQSESVS